MISNNYSFDEFEWLLGQKLSEKVPELSQKMHSSILEKTNQDLNKNFKSFSPWMCYHRDIDRLQKHFKRPYTGKVLDEHKTIESLRKVLESHEGYTDLTSEESFRITFSTTQEMEKQNFTPRINKAIESLFALHPWLKVIFDHLIKEIMSIKSVGNINFERIGLSTHQAKGLILFSLIDKTDPIAHERLVIDIAHECAHQIVQVFISGDKILDNQSKFVYSGARWEEREAIRSFHGIMAHVYESATALRFLEKDFFSMSNCLREYLLEELKTLILRINVSTDQIKKNCTFTALGSAIFNEIDLYISKISKFPLMKH
ncbi:hypothetical protein MRY82_04775 [bacterium]|nr:hypothetical protein [bacterium]